jgi:hypothetical protein
VVSPQFAGTSGRVSAASLLPGASRLCLMRAPRPPAAAPSAKAGSHRLTMPFSHCELRWRTVLVIDFCYLRKQSHSSNFETFGHQFDIVTNVPAVIF